jgi:hypothetical protein
MPTPSAFKIICGGLSLCVFDGISFYVPAIGSATNSTEGKGKITRIVGNHLFMGGAP